MTARRPLLAQRRVSMGYSQEALAEEVGVDRATVGRWERGTTDPQPYHRARLIEVLQVGQAELDALLMPTAAIDRTSMDQTDSRARGPMDRWDDDAMMRRQFLRLAAVTAALIGASEPVEAAESRDIGGQEAVNAHLWRVYLRAPSKSVMYPAVAEQVHHLQAGLNHAQSGSSLRQMCAMNADVLQLAGEVAFDGNHYGDAASCYALAADAAKEAGRFDLWACALVRHALTNLHDGNLGDAGMLLEAAARVAGRGDPALATRYWVAAVVAEVQAQAGDTNACLRALDDAEDVQELSGMIGHGGWLRFDGSRLAEQRGTCYTVLGRYSDAEIALQQAMQQPLSPRRRAAVLTDLAILGIHQHDPDQVTEHAHAVLDLAASTDSGYIWHKADRLRRRIMPLRSHQTMGELYDQLTDAIPTRT